MQLIRANKLSLNTSKTEIVLFKTRNKIITKCLKFLISRQKIELLRSVKYIGIILQDDLYWNLYLSQKTKSSYWFIIKNQTLCTKACTKNNLLLNL